jgi:hypothetical protein
VMGARLPGVTCSRSQTCMQRYTVCVHLGVAALPVRLAAGVSLFAPGTAPATGGHWGLLRSPTAGEEPALELGLQTR